MTHHLLQTGCFGTFHAKHRAVDFAHRWKLSRIAHEHQARAKRVGALQSDLQQGAIDHGSLINQHQAEMLEGHGRLFCGFTQLPIPLSLELQAQQAMDGGGVPGGLQTLLTQRLAQDPHSFVGRCHHGPTQTGGLHKPQQTHGEKGFPAAGKTTQDVGNSRL